jgi:L-threonylcarbamoyladenylate synthase
VKTVITKDPIEAAAFIKKGGIVAFPTETVYGLGANLFDAQAIECIFEAKKRPADNPLIAHIADMGQVFELADSVPEKARLLIDAFFPGPLTIVLKKTDRVPLIATAGLDTIGIRMPAFETARVFLAETGVPIAAPSANLSGRPSPTTWEAVAEDLDGRIHCILQGAPTDIGLESTVVDCTGDIPLLLRKGGVSLADLRRVVPATRAADLSSLETVPSPGLRHKHYSPNARVLIADAKDVLETDAAFIGLSSPSTGVAFERFCSDAEEYAHVLFEFLRECDRRGIAVIYCGPVDESGIGAALMDRLRRAAE